MRRRTFLKVAGAAAALPSVVVPTMAAAGESVSVTAINREAHTIAKSEATWDPDADYTFISLDRSLDPTRLGCLTYRAEDPEATILAGLTGLAAWLPSPQREA
jgi:hypothetical protein